VTLVIVAHVLLSDRRTSNTMYITALSILAGLLLLANRMQALPLQPLHGNKGTPSLPRWALELETPSLDHNVQGSPALIHVVALQQQGRLLDRYEGRVSSPSKDNTLPSAPSGAVYSRWSSYPGVHRYRSFNHRRAHIYAAPAGVWPSQYCQSRLCDRLAAHRGMSKNAWDEDNFQSVAAMTSIQFDSIPTQMHIQISCIGQL